MITAKCTDVVTPLKAFCKRLFVGMECHVDMMYSFFDEFFCFYSDRPMKNILQDLNLPGTKCFNEKQFFLQFQAFCVRFTRLMVRLADC